MQKCQSLILPSRAHDSHEPVSSARTAATITVNLDSPSAGLRLAMNALLPVRRVTAHALASDRVHRFSCLAGAARVGSDWDRDCQSTRYGLGWTGAGTSAACSWLKFRSETTPSSSLTSAPVGVQTSAPCGPPAASLTAPTRSLGGYSNSSASSASPAPSSCSLANRTSLGGLRLAFWLTVVLSSRRLKAWRSRSNPDDQLAPLGRFPRRVGSGSAFGAELAA